jgi:hypothetical protein
LNKFQEEPSLKLIKEFAWYGSAVSLAALMAVALLFASPADEARAAATVTTAGDTVLNLSTNTATGTNTGQALTTNIVLTIGTAADAAIDETVVLDLTSRDFTFDLTSDITATPANGILFDANTVTPTATQATWVIATAATGTDDTVTFTNVKIIAKTNATAGGNIAITGTSELDIADVATITVLKDTANYVVGGSATGATSKATLVGGTLTTITAAGVGLTSATFQTDAGTFTASNGTILFCGDTDVSCDSSGVTDFVSVQLLLPATGKAIITVTPAGIGTVSTVTITTTAAEDLNSITVTTTALSANSAGTSGGEILVTLLNADGGTYSKTTTVTVVTDLGVVNANAAGTTCQTAAAALTAGSDVKCTYSWTGTAGTIELYGNGTTGSATVTITAKNTALDTITATKAVTISGAAKTVTATVSFDTSTAGATPGTGTTTPKVQIVVTDSAGNAVSGQTGITVKLTPTTATGATFAAPAATSAKGKTSSAITLTGVKGATLTAEVKVSSTVKTTVSFTIGGTTTSTLAVTAADIDEVTVGSVTVLAKDSSGNLMQDGTSVTLVVTAGSLVSATAKTSNGVATFTYVSPGQVQEVNATAIVGTKTGSATFNVGAAAVVVATPDPVVATATVLTAPPAGGLTQGSAGIADLDALVAAQTFDVESVWKLDVATQSFLSYFPGAAAFANTLTAVAASDIVTLRSK